MAENRIGYFSNKHDTATNMTADNITLPSGVFGIETDTLKMKVGDGVTAWNSLAYLPGGVDGIDGIDGTNGTNGIDGINGTDGADGVDGGSSQFKPLTIGYAGDSFADS